MRHDFCSSAGFFFFFLEALYIISISPDLEYHYSEVCSLLGIIKFLVMAGMVKTVSFMHFKTNTHTKLFGDIS